MVRHIYNLPRAPALLDPPLPKCNSALQTEKDLFTPEIRPNSRKVPLFGLVSASNIPK